MRFDYPCKNCGYNGESEVKTASEQVYCPRCDSEGSGKQQMEKRPHAFNISSSSNRRSNDDFPKILDVPIIGRLMDTGIRQTCECGNMAAGYIPVPSEGSPEMN